MWLADSFVLDRYALDSPTPLFLPTHATRHAHVKVTSTFKHRKVELRAQGIDLGKVGTDQLLWLNPETERYEPFGKEQSQTLAQGKARL